MYNNYLIELYLQTKGRLKLTDSTIIFKNSKTGKLEQLSSGDIDIVTWQRFAGSWGLRIFAKSGALLRFGGLRESDKEKVITLVKIIKIFSQELSQPYVLYSVIILKLIILFTFSGGQVLRFKLRGESG